MKAAQLREPGSMLMVDATPPHPGPGQVSIRVSGSGICGSNLPLWEGRPWFSYPLAPGAPGHEGWGCIDRVGPEVAGFRPGDPVAMLSEHAFAEVDVANAADVVALPPSLSNRPFPAEAIACAVNVVKRAAIGSGDRVAVVGIGFLGALLVRLAADAGARVIAVSRRPSALAIARDMGASAAVTISNPASTAADARAANHERCFDIVFEVTGQQLPLDIAGELTRTRGRLVIAGYHQDGPRSIDLQLWNWRGLDVINAHERDAAVYVAGMRDAVRLVEGGVLPLDRLVTHRFPLSRADEAFRCAVERPDGFLKAVLTTDES